MTIKAKLEKIFLVLFGTAFIIYGLMIPVLSIVGTKTTGNITTVRKINIERGGAVPNQYAYAVGFEFTISGGKVVSGNTQVVGSPYNAGLSKGPATVMYLKSFPYLNALEESSMLPVERIIVLAVGILFLLFAFRKKKAPKKRSRKAGKAASRNFADKDKASAEKRQKKDSNNGLDDEMNDNFEDDSEEKF